MSRFAEYLETRNLLPLYEQAAAVISPDISRAIRYCESRAGSKLSYVFNAIAHELNKFEVDYGAAFASTAAQVQAKKDAAARAAADADARGKAYAATAAAEAEKKKQEKEAEDIARAGRRYPYAPADMIGMLRHVGEQLKGLHAAGHVSQDYATAIQAMIMDLNTSIRRSKLPTNPKDRAAAEAEAANKAKDRHDVDAKEFEGKAAAAKHYNDVLEVVKTLRAKGLPASVTDAHAVAAYDKLFKLLYDIHKNGGSIRKALNHWLANKEIGDDHASPDHMQVMQVVSTLTELPVPGTHRHEEMDDGPPDREPEPEEQHDDPAPPPKEEEDDDLMKNPGSGGDDEDLMGHGDDASQEPPAAAPEPAPAPAPKPKKNEKLFDLKKLAGLSVPAGEESKAMRLAVDAAIADPSVLATVDEPLNKVLNHIHTVFDHMKTEKGGELSKSHVSKKVNDFFSGKSANPNMTVLVDKIRQGMEGEHFEQLKDVVKHVLYKMHVEKKPTPPAFDEKPEPGGTYDWHLQRGLTLQEQQQHSIMLQTLAGIRR